MGRSIISWVEDSVSNRPLLSEMNLGQSTISCRGGQCHWDGPLSPVGEDGVNGTVHYLL